MMSNEHAVSMQVDKGIVEKVVTSEIKAAIIRAMGGADSLAQSVVGAVLNQKVNSKGKISNYSSDNKYTLVDALAREHMTAAIEEALREAVAEMQPQLKEMVKKEILRRPAGIAKMLVSGLTDSIGVGWKNSFTVTFETPKDIKD